MTTLTLGFKLFFVDLLGGIVAWPFWWYSAGALLMLRNLHSFFRDYARSVAVGVWVKNLFVPMYGVRDWQSRIISVFMRAAQIVARSLFLLVLLIVVVLAFVVYLALPVGTVFFVLFHLTALLS